MAGLLDAEREPLSADLDGYVAATLPFAAALRDLDLERGGPPDRELPLRPIVRIDPVPEAILVGGRLEAHHDAVGGRVARRECDGARSIQCNRLSFWSRLQRDGLEVHDRAALEREATHAHGERLGLGEVETADGQGLVAIPTARGRTRNGEGFSGDVDLQFSAVSVLGGEGEFEVVHSPAGWLEFPSDRVGRLGPETDAMVARMRLESGVVALHARVERGENYPAVGELRRVLGGFERDDGGQSRR